MTSFKNEFKSHIRISSRLFAFLGALGAALGTGLATAQASVPRSATKAGGKPATKLFANGPETFQLRTPNGHAPSFRVLSDSAPKQALALAIEATLNAQADVRPKLPVDGHIDLKFETLTFAEDKGDLLKLTARVSGHDVELSKRVSRAELLAGKKIDLEFEPAEKSVSLFQVKFLGGHFRFRLDHSANRLVIEDAAARAMFSAPFGADGEEAIRFNGLGDRLPPGRASEKL